MTRIDTRFLAVQIAALVLSAVTMQSAQAQTPKILLGINGDSPSNCIAIADANGFVGTPNDPTGTLNATGVVLQGSCNGGTTPGAFGVTISVPATAQINQQFIVTWTASAAAEICAYGEPLADRHMIGWTPGQLACEGSTSCQGTHYNYVMATVPGSYVFTIACTNASGYATKTITVH
ncbi:MAG: hypothetical protein LC098_04270 [Burkholderiales bacterium]|nr:hypothetical protein [Burkholderiales bacterium]